MNKGLFRKGLVFGIILLFIGAGVIPSMGIIVVEKYVSQDNKTLIKDFNSRGNIFYVGGSGEGNYTKIQDAIDDASNGDTIIVYPPVFYPYYYEESVVIDKSINLIGYKNSKPLIYSGGNVITINADWVNISGFEIWGGIRGIYILSNNNTISNNGVFSDKSGFRGIDISSNCFHNTIRVNDIFDWYRGILSFGGYNNVYFNNFIGNTYYHAVGDNTTIWYNASLQQGNYWDDFNEPSEGAWDNDSDGIVDSPYNIPEEGGQDLYPLMYKYGPPYPRFIVIQNNKNVSFNASKSFDYGAGEITYYNWSFDDNTIGTGKIINHTYTDYGVYNVSLKVTDNEGKTNSVVKTIYVENVLPEIIDNTLDNGYTGDLFTFNATITDNNQVSTAWVEHWYGTGTHTNFSMSNTVDDTWERNIIVDDTIETMHYIIATQDIAQNWNDTGVKDVTIYDNDKPELANIHAEPSEQTGAGYVNVSASIVDNVALDEVYLNVEHPDNSIENFSILQNKTGDTYYSNKTYHRVGIYTYHIWTSDTSGNQNISDDYTFEILNQLPYEPDNPIPDDGASGVPISELTLIWSGGDPDMYDVIQYYVYFGNDSDPLGVGSIMNIPYNQEIIDFPIYAHYDLEYSSTYYWKIKAEDNHGDSINGEIWSFTTSDGPVPDLECDGSLNWGNILPGRTVTGYFTVENNGEPTSLLDWEVSEYPDWGSDWTFTPASGTGLTPEDDPVTVGVSVVAPDEPDTEFVGEVKVVNSENPDDYEIIDVLLSTPRTRASSYHWFLERFPLLGRLLGLIIDR